MEDVIGHIRRVVDDPRVKVETRGEVDEASRSSPVDDPIFRDLMVTIREVDARVVVAPGLMVGGTDSKRYAGLSDRIYRFNPMHLRAEELPRLHGVDERIAVGDLRGAVEFFVRLVMRFGR
jgi:carboxypeptidase PM20D1